MDRQRSRGPDAEPADRLDGEVGDLEDDLEEREHEGEPTDEDPPLRRTTLVGLPRPHGERRFQVGPKVTCMFTLTGRRV